MLFKKVATLTAAFAAAALICHVPKVSAYDDRDFIEKCGKRLGYEYLGTTENGKEKQEMYDELYELCCEIWESDNDIPYWKEVCKHHNDNTDKCEAYPYIKIYEGSYEEINRLLNYSEEVVSMLKFDNPLFYFLNEHTIRVDDEDDTNDYLTSLHWGYNNQIDLDHSSLIELDEKYADLSPDAEVEGKFYLGILAYEEYISGNERASINDGIYDYVTGTSEELEKKKNIYDKALFLHNKIITESEYDYRGMDSDSIILRTYYTDSHTIVGVMLKDLGVCESISETFDTVMNYAGMEDILVETLDHAWNLLKFDDGEYYFIDVTWDDYDDGKEPEYTFFKKGLKYFLHSEFVVREEGTILKDAHVILKQNDKYVTCGSYPLPVDIEHSNDLPVPGDVNNDSKVDIEDAVLILGFINGNNALEDANTADIDHNGVIDITDAVTVIGYVNGNIPIR